MENNPTLPHLSVLYQEIIDSLSPKPDACYIDGTLGAGGHAWGILEKSKPSGQLLGLDIDPQALAIASQRLSIYPERAHIRKCSYRYMDEEMEKLGWHGVDGIVLDLGVSSMQLDTPERGFSFRFDGPLDMRFNKEDGLSAADFLRATKEKDLADIIWKYGEERYARKIAKAIKNAGALETTQELAALILKIVPKKPNAPHPATRTFQAIRIAVNKELQTVEESIPNAIKLLNPGGRLAIISFHSLEDRIVKNAFRFANKDCICPPDQPICTCDHKASIKIMTKKPIEPSDEEKERNPRARSAKLRIAEKLKMA